MPTKAEAVMARLKNRKRHVQIKASADESVWKKAEIAGLKARFTDREAMALSALQHVKDQFRDLSVKACSVVHDDRGRALKGSLIVLAAVETKEEADGALL